MVKELTVDDYNKRTKPSVIDFGATWCGPCKMMEPVFDEVSEEVEGFDYYRVDIDQNPEFAAEFHVTSVPTFIIEFKLGGYERIVGAMPKEMFKEKIESLKGKMYK